MSNVSARIIFILEYSKNSLTGGCIGVLGWLIWLFDLYWLCSGVHSLDLPGHIRLAVGEKPSFSPWQFQGWVVLGFLCWTLLCQVLTDEKHLFKKYQWQQDELSLIYRFVWKACLIGHILCILWQSDWIVQSQGQVPSWTCNIGICQDRPSLLVDVKTHYQHVYTWFLSHVTGVSCGPV